MCHLFKCVFPFFLRYKYVSALFSLKMFKFVPTNARSSPSSLNYTMSSVSVYLLQWVQSISRLSVEIYMGTVAWKI